MLVKAPCTASQDQVIKILLEFVDHYRWCTNVSENQYDAEGETSIYRHEKTVEEGTSGETKSGTHDLVEHGRHEGPKIQRQDSTTETTTVLIGKALELFLVLLYYLAVPFNTSSTLPLSAFVPV